MKLGRSSPFYGKLRVKELDPEVYRIWLTRDNELDESPSWLTSHHYEYEVESEIETQDMVDKLIVHANLTGRQILVIGMFMANSTLHEIGREIGVTKECVRRIMDKAYRKIRNNKALLED